MEKFIGQKFKTLSDKLKNKFQNEGYELTKITRNNQLKKGYIDIDENLFREDVCDIYCYKEDYNDILKWFSKSDYVITEPIYFGKGNNQVQFKVYSY